MTGGKADGTDGSVGNGREGETTIGDRVRSPSVKSSLLWGLVGGLSFLVLIQGFELVTEQSVAVGVKAGVALGVTVVATAVSAALAGRVPTKNERD